MVLEAHWTALLAGSQDGDAWRRYDAAVTLVKSMGFVFKPAAEILAAGRDEVVDRLLALFGREDQEVVADAVMGTVEAPQHMLDDLFALYEEHKAPELIGYGPSQVKKHKQPKQRAARYLRQVIGKNKPLAEITRDDALRFKAWWVEKIGREGLTRDAANRSFTDIQGMFVVIDAALQTKHRDNWSDLHIRAKRREKRTKRATYDVEFVQQRILAPGALDSINFEARMIYYASIETGARPSELCNIDPENNRAWDAIPHVIVTETDARILKTENSTRTIPLVGVSLWAMRQCPNGFPSYRDNEDSFSATINKQLKKLGLRPTRQHTAYSIRHTFQDRILAAGASDRLQTDLMGHEFARAKYGEGASLKQKLELLERIKFEWPIEASAI